MISFNDILEIAGFLTGITGVWLTIKKNIWCFPVGIINVVISGWLYFRENLLADSIQQCLFCTLLFVGWFQWGSVNKKASAIKSTSPTELSFLGIAAISFGTALGFVLDRFTDASFPYIDSYATAVCFAAQGLVAYRRIENWHLWIVANVAYILIYISKELYLYSVLYSVYLVLAFAGLAAWKKEMDHLKNG